MLNLSSFGFADLWVLAGFMATMPLLYTIAMAIYNIYFHPLRHIPGPKSSAASCLRYAMDLINGRLNTTINKLHERYGEVVRVAPNEVSFISGETAWQDIYGFHKAQPGKNKNSYLKDSVWYEASGNGVYSMINTSDSDHTRQRRALAHAFSDKALREQEPLIQGYVDLLVMRLREQVEVEGQANMVKWYNFCTFDIIADLTFGESFGCLAEREYHPWVQLVFNSVKAGAFLTAMRHFPMLERFMPGRKANLEARRKFFNATAERVDRRLANTTDRPDFMRYIEKSKNELSLDEIHSNAELLLIAGSETTATTLSGTTYLLLRHPEKLRKLVEEVRGRFQSIEEITIEAVSRMPYLIAVLSESLRLYPPVPTGLPRVVPKGGDTISGYWLPENTSVYVTQHGTNHSSRNFRDPEAFVPERWQKGEEWADDKREVVNNFSFGPRNCLGKNLAYAEMRLILAKVVFNFDLELSPASASRDWLDQKVYKLWEKPPLMVQLKPVVRT